MRGLKAFRAARILASGHAFVQKPQGAGNLLGGYLGARSAVARGAGFVRVFFIVVVSAFIVRIGGDVGGLWGGPRKPVRMVGAAY